MRFVFFFVLLSFSLSPGIAFAAELDGHVKSLNLFQEGTDDSNDIWLSADSLRLDLRGQINDSGPSYQWSLEHLFLYQDPLNSLSLPDRRINRIKELAWDGRSGRALSWQLQVDRLSLQWDWDETVLTVGRQAVGFGRIGLFSPLDIIAPFAPTALDNDVRPGIDALRIQNYFDIVGEIGATAVFGEGIEESSALADLTLNVGQVDILMITGTLRDRPMIGLGLSGQLGGLGVKGEWTRYHGTKTDVADGDLYKQFSIGGIEVEYRFVVDLILQLQYLYNGPGSNNPIEYPIVAQSAPLTEGLSYLYGKHYLLSGLSRNLTPLVRLSGLVIVNLKDDSWQFRPMVDVSIADNVSLDVFWSFYHGKKPMLHAGQPVTQSEFGSISDSGGLFLKIYF